MSLADLKIPRETAFFAHGIGTQAEQILTNRARIAQLIAWQNLDAQFPISLCGLAVHWQLMNASVAKLPRKPNTHQVEA